MSSQVQEHSLRTQSGQSGDEIPFKMVTEERKYLGRNLTGNVQHICEENDSTNRKKKDALLLERIQHH